MSLSFRDRLRRGDRLIGLAACVVRSVDIVAISRTGGFDWLLIDTEHTGLSISDVATVATAAATAGYPALVRVGGPRHPDLARALDCGAVGIVVPHVDSLDDAKAIVAGCRFAPTGRRSIPGPQALLGFRRLPVRDMAAAVEALTTVVLMIESRAGLAAAAEMAALPGVDALMIGANDLAADLGHPGDLCHPDVVAGFRHVAGACRAAGIAFATIGLPENLLPSHVLALGASLVVATNDIDLLIDAGTALSARCGRLTGDRPDRA